jgi:fatty acid synthase subunit alpha
LDLGYRARQLAFRRKQISQWLENEHAQLKEEMAFRKEQGGDADDSEYLSSRISDIESEAARQERDSLATYGMLEGADARIAPLRRALAVWGLTADDIGILSIHGTSTAANEKNETQIWNDVFKNIGRTQGNAVPIMAQKSLVGHSKGGSAAWQLIGLLQSVYEATIPGNRNADNVDSMFQKHTLLMFPSKTIHTDGIKAGVMVSGYGVELLRLKLTDLSSPRSVSVRSAAQSSSSTRGTCSVRSSRRCTRRTRPATASGPRGRTRS